LPYQLQDAIISSSMSNAPLPVLVARFSDEAVGEYLTGVARAGLAVYVPLVSPPSSRALHLLEVHTPGRPEPLAFVAEPLGPSGEKGFPLRLRMAEAPPPPSGSGKETMSDAPPSAGPPSAGPTSVRISQKPQQDPFIGRALAAGKLRIETCVGQGGAGTVYRATHRDLQMHVAVKVMHEAYQRDAEFCKRFQAEALSASRLDHAHLTRVLDYGQEPDGLLYIAMEYLDGKSLRDILNAEKALPFERVAQIMIQVCSGLTHAHARNVVHRDIKPENLVVVRGLDEDGRETDIVKVCDFGIAHRSAADSPAEFAGTAEYIAPEQFDGNEPDVQCDVYACGVVLYELLTGVVPIAGDFPDIVNRVRQTVPEPPSRRMPGLDARVDRLVLKALSKNREIRHASVRELRTELKETAEEISLFSAGGYWDGVGGAVTGRPTSSVSSPPVSARPSAASTANDAGAPDWLERGTGYLSASMSPAPPPVSSAPPGRTSSQGKLPAVRVMAPSYSDMAPQSSRPGQVLPSLGPPSMRASQIDLSAEAAAAGAIMSGSHVSMTPPASSEGDEVGKAVATFLKNIVATTDPDKFAALVAPIEPKIRLLIEQGHIGPAWKLCSALTMIASEPPGLMSRAEFARKALVVYADRGVLAQLAEYALDPLKDRDGLSRKLVSRAGDRGAHAAYSARTKHSVFEARERFIALLLEIGPAALPTIKKALLMLESRLTVSGALWIAEDVLKGVPDVRDEELAQCIARYAKMPTPTLALFATIALPKAAGVRARPLLVAQLHHKEDDVAIAAIKCLRKQVGIDADVVAQLRPIVLGMARARPPVRLAATEALLDSAPDALALARSTLGETLANTHGITPDVDELVVMLCSVLVAIKGDATLVSARWKTSNGFLRTRLETLLRQARI
jgi:serine/threonine protein kinase